MILQKIQIKSTSIDLNKDLLFRITGDYKLSGNRILLNKGSKLNFDTYFNCFAANKWGKYTILESVFISVNFTGKFDIVIYDSHWDGSLKQTEIVNTQKAKDRFKYKLNLAEINGVISFHMVALTDGCSFVNGSYHVDSLPIHKVDLSGVMCTYRKEDYVKKNINIILKGISQNKNSLIKDSFDLILIDNGHSLSNIQESQHLKLIQNKNTGGSGGFTRGMIEVIQNSPNKTHILLMDDDIQIRIESIDLLHAFLAFLKPCFSSSFIGGAMLRSDISYIQQERSAYWSGNSNFITPIEYSQDLRVYMNVVRNEHEFAHKNKFAAWWFCCIPVEKDLAANLPLPMFIRGDDSEYSFRRAKSIININCFCVWHDPFETHVQGYLYSYYKTRNYTITKNIHFTPYSTIGFIKYYTKIIINMLLRSDFFSIDLVFLAVNDFLSGLSLFKKSDPEKKHEQVIKMDEKWTSSDTEMDDKFIKFLRTLPVGKKGWKLFLIASLNGLLIPKIFFKESNIASIHGGRSDPICFFFAKRIFVYNHLQNTMVIRTYSKLKILRYAFKCSLLMIKTIFLYPKILREYNNQYLELTNLRYWKEYLNLKF